MAGLSPLLSRRYRQNLISNWRFLRRYARGLLSLAFNQTSIWGAILAESWFDLQSWLLRRGRSGEKQATNEDRCDDACEIGRQAGRQGVADTADLNGAEINRKNIERRFGGTL